MACKAIPLAAIRYEFTVWANGRTKWNYPLIHVVLTLRVTKTAQDIVEEDESHRSTTGQNDLG